MNNREKNIYPNDQSAEEALIPPDSTGKPTLVLDLDETLIHSKFDRTNLKEVILKLPITHNTSCLQSNFDLDYI